MAEYKTTWFFEGLQPNIGSTASSVASWSETWYQTANDIETALREAVRIGGTSWIGNRVKFMHALYAVKWVRVSNDANPRETKLAAVPAARGAIGYVEGGGAVPYNAETAAQVQCCVLADVVALPDGAGDRTHHRRLLLRGLPRAIMSGNILVENSAAFNGLVQFLNYVARGRAPLQPNLLNPIAVPTWHIRHQDPAAVFVPITALAITAGNDRSITISAGLPGANHGRRLEIRRVTTPQGVNRIWTIRASAAVPAGGPYVLVQSKRPLVGAWSNDGIAALITPRYRPANQYTIIGLRDRQTGSSPFGRTRGRRQAR